MIKMYTDYVKALVGTKIKMKSEKGQGMVEYGLIIGLIAVMLIAVLITMKDKLALIFDKVSTQLGNAASAT